MSYLDLARDSTFNLLSNVPTVMEDPKCKLALPVIGVE